LKGGIDRLSLQCGVMRGMDRDGAVIVIGTVGGGADLDGDKRAEGGDDQKEKITLIKSHMRRVYTTIIYK
jgi:hypothetical protein